MSRTLKVIFLFLIFLSALTACAPTIQQSVMVPARYHQATQVRELAVLPFQGKDGRTFGSEIESVLSGISVSGKPFYTLVERKKLNSLMDELKFSASGLVDENSGVKLGRMIGARGIYLGTAEASVADENYTESRSRCAKYRTYRTKDGKEHTECAETDYYTVNCIDRTAQFLFVPKLVDVASSQVLFQRTYSLSSRSRACSDQGSPQDSPTMVRRLKDGIKDEFRKDIAPYFVTVQIKLMDSDDGIPKGPALDKFEQGIKFAKDNRMDRACPLWEEAKGLMPAQEAKSLAFDLGVCAEIAGALEKAREGYRKADALSEKPDKDVAAAIARVETQIGQLSTLMEQLSPGGETEGKVLTAGKPKAQPAAIVDKVKKGTPAEAMALVEDTSDYLEKNGLAGTLREIGRKDGRFAYKDMSVMVLDANGTCLAHHNEKLVGRDLSTLKDLDGKAFVTQGIQTASRKGSGWVDFKRPERETRNPITKSLYLKKIPGKNILIGCSVTKT